jgi:hypothetical protein
MAARCADKSVTDFAIVAAGDSVAVAGDVGEGVALGSAATPTLAHNKAISAANVVAMLDLKH